MGDARNISQFKDNSFDFILFSFNGIDSLAHLNRLQIFQEVSRVGKPGGYFFESRSRNILRSAEYIDRQLPEERDSWEVSNFIL